MIFTDINKYREYLASEAKKARPMTADEKLIYDPCGENPDMLPQTIAVLGNFDGVHRGHAALLKHALKIKKIFPEDLIVVWTFGNLSKGGGYLTSPEKKAELLEKLGADIVILDDFRRICSLSPMMFVESVLKAELNARSVICGYNYSFGKNRSGNAQMLKQLCLACGLSCSVIYEVSVSPNEGKAANPAEACAQTGANDMQVNGGDSSNGSNNSNNSNNSNDSDNCNCSDDKICNGDSICSDNNNSNNINCSDNRDGCRGFSPNAQTGSTQCIGSAGAKEDCMPDAQGFGALGTQGFNAQGAQGFGMPSMGGFGIPNIQGFGIPGTQGGGFPASGFPQTSGYPMGDQGGYDVSSRIAVSSTRIKEALAAGDIGTANLLLGRPYSVCAEVIRGRHAGTDSLMIPTINQRFPDGSAPIGNGVYAGFCVTGDGSEFPSVTNIGRHPTFGGGDEDIIETHIISDSFSKELYGTTVEVFLLERLRDERKFDSPAALAGEIRKNIDSALGIYEHYKKSKSNSEAADR